MIDPEIPEQKQKKERSTAYPSISLEQALEYSTKLVESYRKNSFSRQNAVEGIGYTKITGDTAQKVAALGHYGLLEKTGTGTYRNTELAQRICYFTSEEQKTEDVTTAAQQPKLFRTLIADHQGQSLPTRLKNILINPHGINPNVADKVAENFKTTLEFAGLLNNGVVGALTVGEDGDSGTEGESANTPVPPPARGVQMSPPGRHPLPPAGMQTLTLPSGIILSYSSKLAYAFAIGKFAAQITALDEAITAASSKKGNGNEANTDAAIE